MLETQIKSDLLKNEIVQLSNLLKESDDIYPVLIKMFCSIRKLDHLHDNKLKNFEDILTNNFMREHST